jgi:predicted N-acetyltransferase YhbS
MCLFIETTYWNYLLELLMYIRAMTKEDVEAVSSVCLASFSTSVADSLPQEGVLTFAKIASSVAFLKRMKEDNLMLIAECDSKIVGVIELKEGRHIAMLFVEPSEQMKGIGRKLLSSALSYAKVGTVTVSASLSSVPMYRKYGFVCKADIAEAMGLIYQPMERELNNNLN